ncbi:MAG TPA: TetR/AcrR family transcriptional regulator [Cellulomonas sp.]
MTTAATERRTRAAATRDTILTSAEHLFAEHGVTAVSNRQIGEHAGQGNNTAVGYHFGTKEGLLRAIVRRHQDQIEHRRVEATAAVTGATDARTWLDVFVRPSAAHLAALPQPSWYARFSAQLFADPHLRQLLEEESWRATTLHRVLEEIDRTSPQMPPAVRTERHELMRLLLVHGFASRERALALGEPTPRTDWQGAADGLLDALTAIWLAPWADGAPAAR